MRKGPLRNHCAADYDDGLPLHGVPAYECQRILPERGDSKRCLLDYARGARYWWVARSASPLLLRLLHELALYAS